MAEEDAVDAIEPAADGDEGESTAPQEAEAEVEDGASAAGDAEKGLGLLT